MKTTLSSITLLLSLGCLPLAAAETDPLKIHREGSEKLADEQDELSADVQQLVIEQTNPKVIELLAQVEDIMDETTERLIEIDTGADTIAAQTEIIEKIHAAAKEKQKQSGSKSGGAMMEMMERMMGKGEKPGQKPGDKPGQKPGDQPGQGQTGDSDTPNQRIDGDPDGNKEIRRVPKSSGNSSTAIPEELRKAFDAYNRGAEQLIK